PAEPVVVALLVVVVAVGGHLGAPLGVPLYSHQYTPFGYSSAYVVHGIPEAGGAAPARYRQHGVSQYGRRVGTIRATRDTVGRAEPRGVGAQGGTRSATRARAHLGYGAVPARSGAVRGRPGPGAPS